MGATAAGAFLGLAYYSCDYFYDCDFYLHCYCPRHISEENCTAGAFRKYEFEYRFGDKSGFRKCEFEYRFGDKSGSGISESAAASGAWGSCPYSAAQ